MIISKIYGLILGIVISIIVCFMSLNKTTRKQTILNVLITIYLSTVFTFIWLPWRMISSPWWNPMEDINFIPFKYLLSDLSFTVIMDTVGNLLVFIPLGAFFAYVIKSKAKAITLTVAICSLAEIVQLLLCIIAHNMYRAIDITDLLLNILGGIVGIYLISRLKKNK